MWTNTKTNWVSTDYFNIEDWQRIRNNLEYLHAELVGHKKAPPQLLDTDTGRGYNELPYVHLVNNMEQNLATLQEIFGVKFTEDVAQKTWYDRVDMLYTSNPTYADWNRWETILQLVYESIRYIDTYIFSTVSGTGYCGSVRTVLKFSRGR